MNRWPAWWPKLPETVTVLLSTYNGAAHLPEQLASLSAQTHPWSLLWRDDGSTDGTRALMLASRGREAMATGRLGVLGSFMALLREAEGTVAFCDQDDVWLPDKLARGAAAVAGETPTLYCARQILVDAHLRRLGESPRIRHAGFPAALTQNVAAGCTIVMNQAAARLAASTTPPPSTLHDWWSYLVVAAAGGRIVADDAATILYRQHGGNAVGAPVTRLRRAQAALLRGPAAFMATLRDHVAALRTNEALLTPAARADVMTLHIALHRPPWQRLGALRRPGLLRQTSLETAVFRAWFLLG